MRIIQQLKPNPNLSLNIIQNQINSSLNIDPHLLLKVNLARIETICIWLVKKNKQPDAAIGQSAD